METKNKYGYTFNENSICIDPRKVWIIGTQGDFRGDHAYAELAQLNNGRWVFGLSWWFIEGGGCFGARNKGTDTFASENEALAGGCSRVKAIIQRSIEREKQWQPISEEYITSKEEHIRRYEKILAEIEKKLDYYEQPTLF